MTLPFPEIRILLRCGYCAFQKDRCKSCEENLPSIVQPEKPMKTDPEKEPAHFPPDPNTWKEILAAGILIFLLCVGVGSCTALCKSEISITVPLKTESK